MNHAMRTFNTEADAAKQLAVSGFDDLEIRQALFQLARFKI
jgi:hypothetical protein